MQLIEKVERPPSHFWAVLSAKVDISTADSIFAELVQSVRDVYGEKQLTETAIKLTNSEQGIIFDVAAIQRAIRKGQPNPEAEGKKPTQLTNYRSEAAEIVARHALANTHDIFFPVAAQIVKGNANQPVLGFDGWGLLKHEEDNYSLVLVQVKGSDEGVRPPSVSKELINECKTNSLSADAISRALVSLFALLQCPKLQTIVFKMLETIGNDKMIPLIVAPVIVRGGITAHIDDLKTLIDSALEFNPAFSRGVTASIGVSLSQFGKVLFDEARKND